MIRPKAFHVKDCALVTLAVGRSAHNLRELRSGVAEVPEASIYHHFHQTLLRHTFDDPEYRNDFALWARRQLHDFHLAERLGVIDPFDYATLEALRLELLDVIEDRLQETLHIPQAGPGREFHFLRSQLVVFGAGLSAATPADLACLVPRLSSGSVFYHFVEARRRPPDHVDDFSEWLLGWGPDYGSIQKDLAAIDFSLWTLTEMRDLIAGCLAPLAARAVRS